MKKSGISRWLPTDAQIICLTKINMQSYPPHRWQLEGTQNDTLRASWHSLLHLDAIGGTTACNSASIWSGWQQWKVMHNPPIDSVAEIKQLLTEDEEAFHGKITEPQYTAVLSVYPHLLSTQNQQGDGDLRFIHVISLPGFLQAQTPNYLCPHIMQPRPR